MGQIVTFYSYKGGTGRSMALANVAWTLATNGQKVLVIDWDLEAPGLHRYFRAFLSDKELTDAESKGLIEFARNYAMLAATPPSEGERGAKWYEPHAQIWKWAIPLRWPRGRIVSFGRRGEIQFVPAGRQGPEYAERVNTFDWSKLYQDHGGDEFFQSVREQAKREFDYVLIDSRTGVSDTSGICTIQMPDILVACYTYNVQSIMGASDIARRARNKVLTQRPGLAVLPVAMRVEFTETDQLILMRKLARERFGDLVTTADHSEYFDKAEVPYYPKYSFFERLAAFEEFPNAKGSINADVRHLAFLIAGTEMAQIPIEEGQRKDVVLEFDPAPVDIALLFGGRIMTDQETIDAAKQAIGVGAKDDFKIQPTVHAAELASKAPPLAAILNRAQFSVLAEEYERKDQEAIKAQEAFKSTVARANWAVFFTTLFSVLLLVATPMATVVKIPDKTLLVVFGVGGIICGGVGAMWLYQVREGKLLDGWMNARASAELLRKQYFEAVTGADAGGTATASYPPALLLQFEYFRRYHFDSQIAYYDQRSGNHRRSAAHVLRTTGWSVALASISLGLAGFLGGIDPRWSSAAALGTVATAIAAFASTDESVYQYRRNFELYSKTGDALRLLKMKFDDVRAAAIAGQPEVVHQFVTAVNELLIAEHRQWLAAAQDVKPALDRLEDTLSRLKPKLPGATTTAST